MGDGMSDYWKQKRYQAYEQATIDEAAIALSKMLGCHESFMAKLQEANGIMTLSSFLKTFHKGAWYSSSPSPTYVDSVTFKDWLEKMKNDQ